MPAHGHFNYHPRRTIDFNDHQKANYPPHSVTQFYWRIHRGWLLLCCWHTIRYADHDLIYVPYCNLTLGLYNNKYGCSGTTESTEQQNNLIPFPFRQ